MTDDGVCFVRVPNVHSSSELMELARIELRQEYFARGWERVEFLGNDAGKTFEVMVWRPGQKLGPDEVRRHFSKWGFAGNASAFITWSVFCDEKGMFITVLPQEADPFPGFAPEFRRYDNSRHLGLDTVRFGWGDLFKFVAFREVKSRRLGCPAPRLEQTLHFRGLP